MAAIRPTTKGCATARFWISRQGFFMPTIMPFSAPESVRVYKTCPLLRRGREEGRRQGCRRGGGCFPLTGGRLRGRAVWQPAGAGDSGYFPSRLRRAGKFRNDDVVFSLRVAPVSGGGHGIACERIPPGFRWEGKPAWRRRFRNDDGLGVVAVCSEGVCRREGLTTGVVRHACRHRVTARGVFVLGDCFTRPELGNDIGLMGALLPFVLRVVAGACVGRGSGSTRG